MGTCKVKGWCDDLECVEGCKAEKELENNNKILVAKVSFKEDKSIRFILKGGNAEWKGKKIKYDVDGGLGIHITYKGKKYRVDPTNIIAGVIDAIDGTIDGENP